MFRQQSKVSFNVGKLDLQSFALPFYFVIFRPFRGIRESGHEPSPAICEKLIAFASLSEGFSSQRLHALFVQRGPSRFQQVF